MATSTPPMIRGRDSAAEPPSRRAKRFARLWTLLEGSVDELFEPVKKELFSDLPDEVVEIGTSLGANFRHMPSGTRVLGFEPNTLFHDEALRRAEEHGIELDLRAGDLRDAGLADDSVEAVVSTLVLCSVDRPGDALREIRRVLRPGGRLVFIEHVGVHGADGPSLYQRLWRRPWAAFVDGCDTCAATDRLIEEAGFRVDVLHRDRFGPRLDPTSPAVWGLATKPGS